MPTVVMFETKKSPKVSDFMRECSQLMNIKGFHFVSQPQNPIIFFANFSQTYPPTELNSLLKQIKAINTYNQSISNIYVGLNMRRR